MKFEQFIKEQGWSIYGIVGIDELKQALKKHKIVFDEWISRHYQANMDYLVRMEDERFDPTKKLPDVKSVIVLGASYCGSNCGSNCGSGRGLVAKYAVGEDYHNVLKKRLIDLSDWLKSNVKGQMSKVETYVSVDSGPTADRALAEVAGLGFFGKNTNIINPKIGSFFFIASVMTNSELPPTEKARMPNCGNCRNCIKNCPTGALISSGVLDARKCVSYLTIENKEGIPEELRPKIGNRLFGCDTCQECCPFNLRNPKPETPNLKSETRNPKFVISQLASDYGAGESLDLKEVLSIKTDEEFTAKFAGTPLMRAKRRGLIRNACVVAGDSGDRSLIPCLQKVIDRENDEMLKEHAEWGINRLKNN
jgi:epoxyqueuosine reductase